MGYGVGVENVRCIPQSVWSIEVTMNYYISVFINNVVEQLDQLGVFGGVHALGYRDHYGVIHWIFKEDQDMGVPVYGNVVTSMLSTRLEEDILSDVDGAKAVMRRVPGEQAYQQTAF